MKRFNATLRGLSLAAAALLAGVSGAMAQSYYDDDIYYDAKKAPKKQEQPKAPRQQQSQAADTRGNETLFYYDGSTYVPWTMAGDYPAASSYAPSGSSTRDVDEYNRRGDYAASRQTDSISLADFERLSAMSATERLARFHDSQTARDAAGVADFEYTDAPDTYAADGGASATSLVVVPATNVSVSFGDGWPFYGSWYGGGWPYYSYYSWPYSSWYWNNWYGPGWYGYGPGWGWGPSWSWSWGGPGWGYPGWGGHHWAWSAPRYYNNPPGATRPNRPHAGIGNGNRFTGNRGGINASNGRRPGTSMAGSAARPATSRPGYSAPVSIPTSGTPAGTYSGSRGRASGSYSGSATRPSSTPGSSNSSGYNGRRSSTTQSSSTPSYSRPASSGSYSGSRGGYSGGGATRSSGGGYSGSRGRR